MTRFPALASCPPGVVGDLLDGVRVLDAGSFLAGPYCAQLLADWGADVIKLEPLGGDPSRRIGAGADALMSATFVGANRGKRSVSLELESADGRAALGALLATSDVVVHNHPPSVAERIGLTAAHVATSNPAAVLCTVSAYGPSGPAARRTALDPIIQAASGLAALTGPADGEPMRCAAPVVDIATGLAAAAACLAALVARSTTGSARHVEVSMFDVALTMQSPLLPLYALHGEELPRRGNGSFALLGDQFAAADGFIALVVWDDARWHALCRVVGRPELTHDARLATNADRHERYADIRPVLAAAIAELDVAALSARLDAAGIPNSVTRGHDALCTDPHVAQTAALYREDRAGDEEIVMVAGPVRVDGVRPTATAPPPRLGQHTLEVLAELKLAG